MDSGECTVFVFSASAKRVSENREQPGIQILLEKVMHNKVDVEDNNYQKIYTSCHTDLVGFFLISHTSHLNSTQIQ